MLQGGRVQLWAKSSCSVFATCQCERPGPSRRGTAGYLWRGARQERARQHARAHQVPILDSAMQTMQSSAVLDLERLDAHIRGWLYKRLLILTNYMYWLHSRVTEVPWGGGVAAASGLQLHDGCEQSPEMCHARHGGALRSRSLTRRGQASG